MEELWPLKFKEFEKDFKKFSVFAELKRENLKPLPQGDFIKSLEHVLSSSIHLLQEYINSEGMSEEFSPKQLLRHAYRYSYIKNAQVWIDAFDQANDLGREELSEKRVHFLKNSFYSNLKYTYKLFSHKIILLKPIPFKFGLQEEDWKELQHILSEFKEIEECVIYGARSTGAFTKSSSVDLALKGTKITPSTIRGLRQAFDDSSLPYLVSVIRDSMIDAGALRYHIDFEGIPINTQSHLEAQSSQG